MAEPSSSSAVAAAAAPHKEFGTDDFLAFSSSTPVSAKRGEKRKSDSDAQPGSSKNTDSPDGEISQRKTARRTAISSASQPWLAIPQAASISDTHSVVDKLHQEIVAFATYISPTPTEHAVRSMVIKLIARVVTTQWPDSVLHPFGSFPTQLYLPGGDVDLVITSPLISTQNRVTVLHTLSALLKRAGIADRIQVIAKAKVPIVKFTTSSKYANIPIDISINQCNGLQAQKIVAKHLEQCPALRPLILIAKHFLSQRGMNEVFTGGLGSYSVICLCISFLQLHPKLRRAEIDPMDGNLGVLLLEFFDLYGRCFNYDQNGITIMGRGGYFSKQHRGWKNDSMPFSLSIEDPQDTENDISKGSYAILRVRQALAGAYELLTARVCLIHESLESRRKGEAFYRRLRDGGRGIDLDSETAGGLGSILGVDRDVLNYRVAMQQLYDSGSLQKALGNEKVDLDEYQIPQSLSSRAIIVLAGESPSSKMPNVTTGAQDFSGSRQDKLTRKAEKKNKKRLAKKEQRKIRKERKNALSNDAATIEKEDGELTASSEVLESENSSTSQSKYGINGRARGLNLSKPASSEAHSSDSSLDDESLNIHIATPGRSLRGNRNS